MSHDTLTIPPEMHEALGVVQRIGGRDLLLRLVTLFEKSGKDREGKFADLLAAGDMKQLSRVAHATKGSAAQMGAEPLRALAATLEKEAHLLEPAQAAERVEALQAEVARTMHVLAAFLEATGK